MQHRKSRAQHTEQQASSENTLCNNVHKHPPPRVESTGAGPQANQASPQLSTGPLGIEWSVSCCQKPATPTAEKVRKQTDSKTKINTDRASSHVIRMTVAALVPPTCVQYGVWTHACDL